MSNAQNIKKIKNILASLALITPFLIIGQSAQAVTCEWTQQIINTGNPAAAIEGGCSPQKEALCKDQCNIDSRPAKSNFNQLTRIQTNYICCPTIDSELPVLPPPKFKIPELQISIPGLTFSDAICTTEDGQEYDCSIPWIGQYVKAIYNYGFSVAGILAAIVLMAGGVLWIVSGGDASRVTKAKELITGSIVGLMILASSYIILTQINPDLVNFQPVSLGAIGKRGYIADTEPYSVAGNPTLSSDCANCVTSTIIPCKDGNQLNADLYKKLLVAWNNSGSLAWRITEAYPPTVQHQSKCHNNGMCVDVALTGDKSCTNIAKLEKILRNAGLTVLNEYVGCGGVETQFSTGGHFHVQ